MSRIEQLDKSQIAALTDDELTDYRYNVGAALDKIREDMTAWEEGYLIQRDAEWYARVRVAKSYWKATEALVKRERGRRPAFAHVQKPTLNEIEKSWRYNALHQAVSELGTPETQQAIFDLAKQLFEEKRTNYSNDGRCESPAQEEPEVWVNQAA